MITGNIREMIKSKGHKMMLGLLAALLCGKVGKRSNKRLVKSHKKLRSV